MKLSAEDVRAIEMLLDLGGAETPVRLEGRGILGLKMVSTKRNESGALTFAVGEAATPELAFALLVADMGDNP